jgi:hypothetical protein
VFSRTRRANCPTFRLGSLGLDHRFPPFCWCP